MKSILIGIAFIISCCYSCKKAGGGGPGPIAPDPDTTVLVVIPADPEPAATMGFFLDDWQPKNFVPPAYTETTAPVSATYTVTVDASQVITKIPRSLSGNNANLWMTQLVTAPKLVSHITQLHPHIIRFPGGSISDVFFWNAANHQPPADAPAQLRAADGSSQTAGYWFGQNAESWTLSVANYYQLLQQTGNQGLITINYGYARYGTGPNPVETAAHLAADWVRYDNGRTRYWEIGNENFGDWEAGYRINTSDNQDGQPEFISGQLYGQQVNVFMDSMRKAASETGKPIKIGAVLVESASPDWATNTHKQWNAGLLAAAAGKPDYYVVHNYYTPYNTNSNASDILNTASSETAKMMDFVKQSWSASGTAARPLALDEWNIFAVGSKQQVSHINGMHGVLVLGAALQQKIGLTARWDLANGWDNGNDHGMFSNGDEPGVEKWNPRPVFYHLYYFQQFLGDRLIPTSHAHSTLFETIASTFSSGELGFTLVNKSTSSFAVKLQIKNFRPGNRVYWYALTGGTDNGEFSRKVLVNGQGPAGEGGGPEEYAGIKAFSAPVQQKEVLLFIPARSTVVAVVAAGG